MDQEARGEQQYRERRDVLMSPSTMGYSDLGRGSAITIKTADVAAHRLTSQDYLIVFRDPNETPLGPISKVVTPDCSESGYGRKQ